jgi:predicted DsbA family dithiol-disulfide isomerase
VQVEIWSDVVCPWCYVGKARFEEALRRLGWDDGEVTVTYRPFELDRHVPPEGYDLVEYLQAKFGPGASIEAIEGRVAEAGADLGLEFDWARARRVNTFAAHQLLEWALRTAGPDAQARLKSRLMRAYFAEGGDVSDPATLATLAAEVDLDADAAMAALVSGEYEDAVRAGQQQARDLDIHAVPTFVVERRFAIPGAQDPETFVSVLARMQSKLADERDDATD